MCNHTVLTGPKIGLSIGWVCVFVVVLPGLMLPFEILKCPLDSELQVSGHLGYDVNLDGEFPGGCSGLLGPMRVCDLFGCDLVV